MENRLRLRPLLIAAALTMMAMPLALSTGNAATVAAPTDTSAAGELAYWNQIKETGDAEDFENYMKLFPDGMFLDLAKAKQGNGQPAAVEDDSAETPTPPPVVKTKVKKVVVVTAKKKPRGNVFLGEKKRLKKIVTYKKVTKKAVRVKKARVAKCPYIWRNGKCVRVAKVKYRKPANKTVVYRPAVEAPPPKVLYDGGGGVGGSGGSSWNN